MENRVREIRNLSEIDSFVPGDQNPADLPSLGCEVSTLIGANWWKGPDWLEEHSSEWPISNVTYLKEEIEGEIRKAAKLKIPICETGSVSNMSAISLNIKSEPFYVPNVSKFSTMVDAFAWLSRFVRHIRWPAKEKCEGTLTVEERKEAKKTVLRISQIDSFAGIEDERLSTMNAAMDNDKLMRIRSKLLQRDDVYSFRYPVVLLGKIPSFGC